MPEFDSLLGEARERALRTDLNVHDHVCGIYDSHEEQFEPACTFIKAGLVKNEQCLYIAEHLKPAEFKIMLEQSGVNAGVMIAKGNLTILDGDEMFLKLGSSTQNPCLRSWHRPNTRRSRPDIPHSG